MADFRQTLVINKKAAEVCPTSRQAIAPTGSKVFVPSEKSGYIPFYSHRQITLAEEKQQEFPFPDSRSILTIVVPIEIEKDHTYRYDE